MRAPLLMVGVVLLSAACSRQEPANQNPPAAAPAAAVDEKRLLDADNDASNWVTHGRNYAETRFSPLKRIDASNVSELKLAWFYDLPTDPRAQESTPLVIDGVMYVTGAWSKVFALNPRSGEPLWSYDPKVPGEWAANACCDVVNRGVAAWNGKVFLGTLDGRLIALDARTGKPVWETLTIDKSKRYTITGAPRVVKGKVIIGNGGSEMGVRGYVSAYDAETGSMVWRFYTVPGEPGKPDGAASDAVLAEKAQKTWTGEWWKMGGGGTVWDSMAYDPKLDLLYIGVGNGSPWNQAIRSPGGGDNLFICSILALRPDTGEYVWHYQETPGESWDYTATQHMILAEMSIGGRERQVIMQAPKNGFFYVLDRATGELISAEPFATVNWAQRIDVKTGRPVENPEARYGTTKKPWIAMPGPAGAHNWTPMSFSPETRLVYIPVTEMGFPYFPPAKAFETRKLSWNVGIDLDAGSLPQDPAIKAQVKSGLKGHLAAWDPVAQKEVWRVEHGQPWNGGVLSTAGNLVFQGNAKGEINAYQADTGARLWTAQTGTGVLAPPVTYEVDGQQYVTVEVGWGGAFGLAAGELARDSHLNKGNWPRVLTYKINGSASLPPVAEPDRILPPPPSIKASESTIAAGKALFHQNCGTCHGDSAVSGGVLPDLRFSKALGDADLWKSIVHDGALKDRGMISFAQELSPGQIETIRVYVARRANESVTEARGSQQAQANKQ